MFSHTFTIALLLSAVLSLPAFAEDHRPSPVPRVFAGLIWTSQYAQAHPEKCLQIGEKPCCFDTELAKIVNEQAAPVSKYMESGVCGGFTPEEFKTIDLENMDFTEWVEKQIKAAAEPSAKEFCIGNKASDKHGFGTTPAPFPCISKPDEGLSVPVFLQSLKKLCPNCAAALQDLLANTKKPSDKPVTADDLQKLLVPDQLYDRLLAAKVLYNYLLVDIAKGIKGDGSVSAETAKLLKGIAGKSSAPACIEDFKQRLEAAKVAAIADPTNKEKARAWLSLQEEARHAATQFANTVAAVIAEDVTKGAGEKK